MTITLGKKINQLRKDKGLTQDYISERLGVSPQAVSKWENDISYPDITLLPELAKILEVTVDELLSHKPKNEIRLVPESQRKNFDDMILRVLVNSADGDKVRINLPMPLIKVAIEMGMSLPEINGNDALKNIDFSKIIDLVEKGVIGKLVEVESADGDIVEIVVE